jgi:hypothetical protein
VKNLKEASFDSSFVEERLRMSGGDVAAGGEVRGRGHTDASRASARTARAVKDLKEASFDSSFAEGRLRMSGRDVAAGGEGGVRGKGVESESEVRGTT